MAGVAVDADGVAATSDGQGQFSLTVPAGTTSQRVALTAPQILSRTVFLTRSTRRLTLDVIRTDDGAFDPAYYRQLVRNGLDSTTGLQPIRRWTRAPSFYIKTVNEAGEAVDPQYLDTAESEIRQMVPIYTAGRFDTATVERGTESRETTAGWITVKWLSQPDDVVCGRAHVGLELGATITFTYLNRVGCGCDGLTISHRIMRHEVGHAMGFWHTDRRDDVMYPRNISCHTMPSDRERFHAAVAYSRPVGNTDPDIDPSTTTRVRSAVVVD